MPRNRSTPRLSHVLKAIFPLPSNGKPKSEQKKCGKSAATAEIELPKDPQCLELAQLLNSPADKVRVDTCQLPEAAEKEYLFADLEFETCTLTVAFSRGLVEAFLAGFSYLEDFEQEDLFALLESHNLSCLDFEPVERAVNTLIESGQKTCWREIAMGTPPEPVRGQKPRIEFAAEESLGDLAPYFGLLANGKATEYPNGICACWVEPGQPLATLEPPSEGTPGQDVFGYEIAPPVDEESTFVAGPGVGASSDGTEFRALYYGYVYLLEDSIGIRDPLCIDSGGSSCHFEHVPAAAGGPDAACIEGLLERQGVCRGIDREAIEKLAGLAEAGPARPHRTLVAAGRAPRHGRSGKVEYWVESDRATTKVNENGTIDFNEKFTALNVRKGAKLARLQPAVEGRPGFTIFGDDLDALGAKSATLKPGPNVEVEEEPDGTQLFTSAIDGRATFSGETVSVLEFLQIAGDVGGETGNVNFSGDVYISGSLLSGSTVAAGGSVYLRGRAEPGSSISAGRDIVAARGIVGEETRVVAEGSVSTRLIEGADIRCAGDLRVGCYIKNARVSSGGLVTVIRTGLTRSGTISGGRVVGARGIRATFAGSPRGTKTEIIAGVDPRIQENLNLCQQKLGACEEDLDRLHRLLGTETITIPNLKLLLRRTSPQKRSQISGYIRQWQRTRRIAATVKTRREKLNRELARSAMEAMVQISQTIYPGVHLRVGDRSSDVKVAITATTLTQKNWPDDGQLQAA